MRSKRLAIIALGIVLVGCQKRPARTIALPPQPAVVPVVVPVAVPVPVPLDIPGNLPASAVASPVDPAEAAYLMGDYDTAIEVYEEYLQSDPNGDHIDQALFRLGMAYVLRTKLPANWTLATASLKRLVSERPDSPFTPTAALILSLRSHADQLTRDAKARNEALQQLNVELERLKKIDADRRKRP